MLAVRSFYYFSFELAMRARCRLFGGRCAPGAVCSAGDEWRQIVHFEMSGGNSRETAPHFIPRCYKNRQPLENVRKPPLIVGRETALHINCFRDQLICSRDESAAHIGIDAERKNAIPSTSGRRRPLYPVALYFFRRNQRAKSSSVGLFMSKRMESHRKAIVIKTQATSAATLDMGVRLMSAT